MTQSMLVYVGLAVMTTFLAQLEHLNSDELPNWTWIGWSRFGGYICLAALTTFKAYVSRPPEANNGLPALSAVATQAGDGHGVPVGLMPVKATIPGAPPGISG